MASSMDGGGAGSGPSLRGAIARLRQQPAWVWITILLTFGLLIFAYLQYKRTSSSTAPSGSTSSAGLGTVPSDGSGQPNWATADTTGMLSGPSSDFLALLQYLQSVATPNPPNTAPPGGDGGNNSNGSGVPPVPNPPNPPSTAPSTTQVRTITLSQPESLQDIATQYTGGQVDWLKSWNAQLSKQPGFSKPWWTLPKGTVVNIPYKG